MASQKFAPSQTVTFNVRLDSYTTFISTLRGALAGTKPDKVRDRPVLAKQTGETSQPPRWIHVVLNGDDGAAPKVAIRSDNAYIAGFANRPTGSTKDVWYQLSPRGSTQLFEGAKMLGFSGHYSTLVGGQGVKDLPTLELGKERTLEAANVLWNYKQDKLGYNAADTAVAADPQRDLKKKLALLAVTLCEAARLEPVRGVIDGGWQRASISITNKEVSYIGDWSDLSAALLAWKADKFKNDTTHFSKFAGLGILDGNGALAVVQLLLNKPPKKGLLAWLKHLWGLLVKKNNSHQMQQEEKQYDQQKPELGKIRRDPKSSSIVNPL
ncbi:60 kDa jasmonate-induced protein-like [Panicum miliaceum]|uniref:rRNA N-glycosylase n=1 Tax=Panicum miliaceum TaxID=4540 RepID=A0A3L6RKK1_PANMI|nr:60 kDa jasmonate-induced protein-like [Panicum miliaceum]